MDSTSSVPRQLSGLGSSPRITSSGVNNIRKEGDAFRILKEAEAMEFVRKNTSLPVPAVFETQIGPETGLSSLTMEKMPGRQLGQACITRGPMDLSPSQSCGLDRWRI
ncbi:hypothetical protein EV127DRAFT_62457 [Xylaria flabelliformis]|nr:hypothetical protein EV127DRAFT_62457 [Xylaria flabelliformis]